MFTEKDMDFIHARGQSKEQLENQLERFKEGFPFMELVRPATPGDGLEVFSEAETADLAGYYEQLMPQRQALKFVPASGAATRMFKSLFEFVNYYDSSTKAHQRYQQDIGFNGVKTFIDNLPRFAFYEQLKHAMAGDGINLEDSIKQGNLRLVITYVLDEKGLGYGVMPKGLLAFHNYPEGARTAFEEHLVEGMEYARNADDVVSLHFTVSPEHREGFLELTEIALSKLEKQNSLRFNVGFSEQKPSTDTIAVDLENRLFRNADGSLLFRPAGHGALIENLNDLRGDVVFVKNIDNIVPDCLKTTTYLYKKVIGGYLLKLQARIFELLKELEINKFSASDLKDVAHFAFEQLHIHRPIGFDKHGFDQQGFLFRQLNRPLRVCGMVRNEGEPGGGPFWAKGKDETISLQIVESSQVDLNNEDQKSVLALSTHFNPVDLVCGLRDFKGIPFDLAKFVDPSSGFISEKSKDGQQLKAMELPGLWNGAMADWISVFVEVPIETFNPVKTINDLLRKQHQSF